MYANVGYAKLEYAGFMLAITVSVTGVLASGSVGEELVWGEVDTSQLAEWNEIAT